MDKTVPAGAALLLDFIAETETGRNDASKYRTVYAHKEGRLPKPITSMTVNQWIAAGPSWTKNHGSSAAGAYQFMNATTLDLKRELGLRGAQVMDPDLQDRLGYHLLRRRGYDAFMSGDLDRVTFAKNLAKEWASFPVLEATSGPHRRVERGQSYYSGDRLNKALIAPEKVEKVLAGVRKAPARDFDTPDHIEPTPKGKWATVLEIILKFIALIFTRRK